MHAKAHFGGLTPSCAFYPRVSAPAPADHVTYCESGGSTVTFEFQRLRLNLLKPWTTRVCEGLGYSNDVTQLIPLLERVPPVRGKVGRPRKRPDGVTADRGSRGAWVALYFWAFLALLALACAIPHLPAVRDNCRLENDCAAEDVNDRERVRVSGGSTPTM